MIRRVVVAISCFVVFLAIAASQTPKVEVQKLPTQVDEFGGRPGTFHFVTNEQTMANMAELQKTFAALESLDAALAKLDPATRSKLSPDVQQLRAFANGVHRQASGSAGKTAGEVEQRLNDSKGKFMCGACHGHGMGKMMHRRPMHEADPKN